MESIRIKALFLGTGGGRRKSEKGKKVKYFGVEKKNPRKNIKCRNGAYKEAGGGLSESSYGREAGGWGGGGKNRRKKKKGGKGKEKRGEKSE